jgi:hypothetical protein
MKRYKLSNFRTLVIRIYLHLHVRTFTYDHRILNTTHPVCSAIFKQDTGGLVVKWVTIGESLLLYVFDIFGVLKPNF